MESTACSAEDMQGSCLSTSPAYHVHREAASTSSSACTTAVEPTQLSERFHQLHQRDSIKQEQQLTIRPSPASPIPHAALLQQVRLIKPPNDLRSLTTSLLPFGVLRLNQLSSGLTRRCAR